MKNQHLINQEIYRILFPKDIDIPQNENINSEEEKKPVYTRQLALDRSSRTIFFITSDQICFAYSLEQHTITSYVKLTGDTEEESALQKTSICVSLEYIPENESLVAIGSCGTIIIISIHRSYTNDTCIYPSIVFGDLEVVGTISSGIFGM